MLGGPKNGEIRDLLLLRAINSYFFANLAKFFGDIFFAPSDLKRVIIFFEKGHIWPAGHRLATPAL